MKRIAALTILFAAMLGCAPTETVGPTAPGEHRLPTGQLIRPAGDVLEVAGRPVDGALSPDRKTWFVKDMGVVRFIDVESWTQSQELPLPGGASIFGVAFAASGDKAYATSATNQIHEYVRAADGKWSPGRSIELPGPAGKGASFPCGLALDADGQKAWVCLSRNNTLAEVDLVAGKLLREIAVDVSPYAVVLRGAEAYVTCQGGRPPKAGERTAPSAGTPVAVEVNGVTRAGSLVFVDLAKGVMATSVDTPLQPSQALVLPDGETLVVANANDDTVSWYDLEARKKLSDLVLKLDERLSFGSMPNALALSVDGKRLFVALAGNNAIAAVDVGRPRSPKVLGFIPSGWYPSGLAVAGERLLVVNNKGVGSRTPRRPIEKGWNSHDHRGSLQRVVVETRKLREWTADARSLGRTGHMLRAAELSNTKAKPVPVPAKIGDPSVFKHVFYVIKENRTYDQVFGDIEKGEGDPNLCIFPKAITPNHHALAEQYVLLDNYYCMGVLSADGHSYATEGNVTPYLNRAFGGFNRSYTFGDDPITYSATGFLWDSILGKGLSFRNYGEFDTAQPPRKMTLPEIYAAHMKGERITFSQEIGVERVRRYSDRDYPGWNMIIPDVLRMDRFLEEFREFEKNGDLPNLVLLYLPQDHLGGGVTSRAHMADNDLAVGRLVEAVSKSRFWKESVIFINEDDPQNGYDHIDGHRSICLVVSPYSRRSAVVREFYNQASVLATILRIFGCPPMNQTTASANLMAGCFDLAPDATPYVAIDPGIPLDETTPPASTLSGEARKWAGIVERLPLSRPGLKTPHDDDQFSRAVWFEMRGDTPYPADLTGPHGKGLKERNLIHVATIDDD